MLSYEEIKNYCTNYKIENGTVIEKSSNKPVTDEETILKVKSSILIFKEAQDTYKKDMEQFGRTSRSQEDYITKTMEKFGTSGEVNTYGINKVVNAILESNGHYEEMISGSDLQNSKFSILVAPKQDYGLAYLKLKFREKGLDIENLKISQDLTELKHNGVSKVIIDFKVRKYERTTSTVVEDNIQSNNRYMHPMAKELNALEKAKQDARRNNDIEAYKRAQADIEEIIRNNPATVSPEKWDSMSIDEQISYVQIKMNESKILHDQDSYNYWNANLANLQSKKQETQSMPKEETPINNSQVSTNEKGSNNYYEQLLSAINRRRTSTNITEEEKKQIIGEIYYNMGYLVEHTNADAEIMDLLSKIVVDLSRDDFEKRIQEQIIAEIQEKYNKQKKESIIEPPKEEQAPAEKTGINIEQLKNNLKKLQTEYQNMLSDGYIDDDELSILIKRMNELSKNADGLMKPTLTPRERQILNIVIDSIDEEKKKMIQMQNKVEEISRGSR